MKRHKYIAVFFFLLPVWGIGAVNASAAACPSSKQYGIIYYNHHLLNQYVSSGTFSQVSGLSGPVGIQISSQGIVNAGNNKLNRTIDLVYTTSQCDCLSDTAESLVSVTVTGTCSNGLLNMQVKEVFPNSSALVTCTGGDSCPIYTQQYPGSTNTFNLQLYYSDGYTLTQPYTCPNCSGTYSWRLQKTNGPPPPVEVPLVSIAPLLHLMLRQANP